MVFSAQHQFTPERVDGYGISSMVMNASGYAEVASVGPSISFPCDQQRLTSVLEHFCSLIQITQISKVRDWVWRFRMYGRRILKARR